MDAGNFTSNKLSKVILFQETLNKLTIMKPLSYFFSFLIFTLLITHHGISQTNTFPSSGSVGIGTTSPSSKLDVYNTVTNWAGWFRNNTGSDVRLAYPGGYGIFINTNVSTNPYLMHLCENSNTVFIVKKDKNIGIGTSSPAYTFEVNGEGTSNIELYVNGRIKSSGNNSGYWADNVFFGKTGNNLGLFNAGWHLQVASSGKVGIGTNTPQGKLQVADNINGLHRIYFDNFSSESERRVDIRLGVGSTGTEALYIGTDKRIGGFGAYIDNRTEEDLRFKKNGVDQLVINTSGYVGIGTSTPTSELSVNGIITTKEVKVDISGWPDYVFKENYSLMDLTDLDRFIKGKKHLPDIPNATEIEEAGLVLGEMNKLLLKKLEEMTLYMIQLNKEINKLKKEIVSITEKSGTDDHQK